jgi:hypothetical protein
VRAEARAREGDGEVRSPPLYECVRVRHRSISVGITGRFGRSSDTAHASTPPNEATFPTAGLVPLTFGIDVSLPIFISGLRDIAFSGLWFAPTFGFTYNSGTYPCPSRDPTNCDIDLSIWPREVHFTTSSALEVRGQLRTDLVRLGPIALRLTADIGIGLEILSSSPSYGRDGAYGLFISGALVEIVAHVPGPAQGIGAQVRVGIGWQVRQRFPSANDIQPGFVLAPGVPDVIDTWYGVIGSDFGLPQ